MPSQTLWPSQARPRGPPALSLGVHTGPGQSLPDETHLRPSFCTGLKSTLTLPIYCQWSARSCTKYPPDLPVTLDSSLASPGVGTKEHFTSGRASVERCKFVNFIIWFQTRLSPQG